MPDNAESRFEEALAEHARGDRVFERARTELAYGAFLRRQRRRVDAREHLRAALETFDALDAMPWASRARSELRASGETARARSEQSASAELTPQELQVAKFVSRGLSNREVWRAALPQPAHRRLPLAPRVHEAWHLVADRARGALAREASALVRSVSAQIRR
jgi:hypothetical protein